jgi:hypothetical protein
VADDHRKQFVGLKFDGSDMTTMILLAADACICEGDPDADCRSKHMPSLVCPLRDEFAQASK